MQAYLIVFLGAGIGGALRHGVNIAALRLFGGEFPFGTLAVNIIGSLCMGLLAGIFELKADPGLNLRLFLITGVLGGFTTFSAFSLDAALLYERGQLTLAALYIAVSVGAALGGLFAGMFVIRQLS